MFDSMWDIFWYTLTVFVFVAYLLVLFQIIGDLFRDRSMSGFVRVLWIIFLVVLPYLTAFVYIITRGRGITERQAAAHTAAKKASDEYIRDVAGKSAPEQISEAKTLLDSGVIDAAEFATLKAKALS
ncbi:SHOCT domain-containing protein [Rhodococcus sp. (in: high G+C Gram-positive bacteria)]|uniref:SHOCT domain-containing protein n=1 Tax=Rhodococcus sp. TaxID=1831 RepID=UPI00257B3A25|nr:SHOCT domain-containing protein [Rhodococcus sp. (in: high G+C Gram-positive bacteria)]MBQ7806407.1 SHOCT domain-containing protein [Rhodococcus sp. (in: high G+C Gram-positive bacteria)]